MICIAHNFTLTRYRKQWGYLASRPFLLCFPQPSSLVYRGALLWLSIPFVLLLEPLSILQCYQLALCPTFTHRRTTRRNCTLDDKREINIILAKISIFYTQIDISAGFQQWFPFSPYPKLALSRGIKSGKLFIQNFPNLIKPNKLSSQLTIPYFSLTRCLVSLEAWLLTAHDSKS